MNKICKNYKRTNLNWWIFSNYVLIPMSIVSTICATSFYLFSGFFTTLPGTCSELGNPTLVSFQSSFHWLSSESVCQRETDWQSSYMHAKLTELRVPEKSQVLPCAILRRQQWALLQTARPGISHGNNASSARLQKTSRNGGPRKLDPQSEAFKNDHIASKPATPSLWNSQADRHRQTLQAFHIT